MIVGAVCKGKTIITEIMDLIPTEIQEEAMGKVIIIDGGMTCKELNEMSKYFLKGLIDGLCEKDRKEFEDIISGLAIEVDGLIMAESNDSKPVEYKDHWKHKQKKNPWERR